MEEKHTEPHKDIRNSSLMTTLANITKMYVGITFIAGSKSISQAGIYGAILGFSYCVLINGYTVWLMVKARNRFKNQRVVDIGDLAGHLFGDTARSGMKWFLAVNNTLFLSVYVLYFGTQMDQLMCKTFEVSSCGYEMGWAAFVNAVLLPVIFLERLSDVGVFSGSLVVLTVVSIGMIFYTCLDIYTRSQDSVK
jgi:hypothetical protein